MNLASLRSVRLGQAHVFRCGVCDGFSPDLLIIAFYFAEEDRIGFLFEQDDIVSNDYALEYSFGQQDVRFDVSDMGKSRKEFWDKVSDLYARAVLDEMDEAFERDTFGPIIG